VTVTHDPAAGHLDLDMLAELEEGLAEPQAAAAARPHLETCAACHALLSRLRTTRALLSALPPEPMPAEVAARVDSAVRRAGEVATTTVVPLARRNRVWSSPAIAGGAAAAAVVALIAALVAGNVIHRGHGNAANTSTAAGDRARSSLANPSRTKTWATGRDYTAATIATLVPSLVTGTPPAGVNTTGTAGTAGPAATPAAPASTGSQTPSYSQDELRASPQAVQACGQILAGGVSTSPVAVDFARFGGKPAVIFVLPAIGHPTDLDVWVVRSACSAASLDLYFQRVPSP
jgi:hypothetical protein